MKRIRVALALVGALLLLAPAFAQTTLTITCRCVDGGVNDALVDWVNDWVKPEFEAAMAAQGTDVVVELIEFGGSDEALKEQYALDLSVGAGADVLAFDGFWVPEFVGAGTLKPLAEVAGAQVNEWEGWAHIPDGLEALMGYEGERYGIALGTDFRMIFYRKDVLAEAGIANADSWQPTSWQDIIDTARAVKEAMPDSAPLQINAGTAMGEATTMQGFYMLLLGTGHGLQDDDGKWIVRSQGLLDVLEFYQTVYVDNALGSQRIQLLQDGRNRSFANFRDGTTAMLVEGDWFWRSVTAPGSEFEVANRDDTMGWAKMPAMTPGAGIRGQDFVTISGGTGFTLNPNSDAPEMAWQLLAFMNSQEGLAAAQQFQPRIRVRDDVPVPDSPFLTETSDVLGPYTTARPNEVEYAEISFEAQLMTERVVSGEMSPQQAMDAYAAAVSAIVGSDNTVDLMGSQ